MKKNVSESVNATVVASANNTKISSKTAVLKFRKKYNSRFRVLDALNDASDATSANYIEEVGACFLALNIEPHKLTFSWFDNMQYQDVMKKDGTIEHYETKVLCTSCKQTEDGKIYGYNVAELRPESWLRALVKVANKMQSLRKKYPHADNSTLLQLL